MSEIFSHLTDKSVWGEGKPYVLEQIDEFTIRMTKMQIPMYGNSFLSNK